MTRIGDTNSSLTNISFSLVHNDLEFSEEVETYWMFKVNDFSFNHSIVSAIVRKSPKFCQDSLTMAAELFRWKYSNEE